ncbi:MAG TPA: ABC transporter ATP-binding protein [Candidatus Eisenbacteria bacterium]|jgi:ABC-2 type transport system ATP-binding protein
MTERAPAVDVRGLTRRFGPVVAVDAISFSVAPGELFGLVGPDGAGKTTTLRMLAGVLRPSGGDALLQGISVARDPERMKDRIAYMPQRFGLYADLTVLENLVFYADLYGVPREARAARLDRLFRFSNLGPFRDRLAGQLSGGMKQKLALSCALLHQPEVLLLDEPTFGVDPVSRRDLWLIVHDRVAEGATVVVSTAYMDEAERFDRVALLAGGRILALDTPAALQEGLEGQILSIRVERPREARRVLSGHSAVRRAAVFGDQVHVSTASAAAAAPGIRRLLEAEGFAVASLSPVAASMEDVFIERIAAAGSPGGSAPGDAP